MMLSRFLEMGASRRILYYVVFLHKFVNFYVFLYMKRDNFKPNVYGRKLLFLERGRLYTRRNGYINLDFKPFYASFQAQISSKTMSDLFIYLLFSCLIAGSMCEKFLDGPEDVDPFQFEENFSRNVRSKELKKLMF